MCVISEVEGRDRLVKVDRQEKLVLLTSQLGQWVAIASLQPFQNARPQVPYWVNLMKIQHQNFNNSIIYVNQNLNDCVNESRCE